MTKYFVQRIEKNKGTGVLDTVINGKEDMGFELGQFLSFRYRGYMIRKYGFATIPAAKRCWSYRNQKETVIATVEDVRIVAFTVGDAGRITMEDVK